MNGPKYMKLLKEKLKLHMHMQDDISCHRSKVATEFLKKNKMSVLEWLGENPDLNPVNNLWTVMKDKEAHKQPCIFQSVEG